MDNSSAEREYMPDTKKLTQLISAGILSTLLCTLTAYLIREAGAHVPDFVRLYGAIFNGRTFPTGLVGAWWAGLGAFLICGIIVFPLLFDFLTDRQLLSQKRWLRGLAWGSILWLFNELVIDSLAGVGIFWNQFSNSTILSLWSYFYFIGYGLLLETFTRTRIVHELEITQKRAA